MDFSLFERHEVVSLDMTSSRLNAEMEELLSEAFSPSMERDQLCHEFMFNEVDFPASSELATIGIESILSPISDKGSAKVFFGGKWLLVENAEGFVGRSFCVCC